MARWIDEIQEYNFTIEYKKSVTIVSADGFSKVYDNEGKIRVREYAKKHSKKGNYS